MIIQRVKSRKVFLLARSCQSFFSDIILVKFIKSEGLSLGVVVNKKVGGAVARNYNKRRIRHAFRDICKKRNLQQLGTFIVIAKPELNRASFATLSNQLSLSIKHFRKDI